MSRWLARLSFSFLILAAVVAWQGRKLASAGESPTFYYLAAAILGALFFVGLRERHRLERDQ